MHAWMGLAGLVLFLLTGQYMHWALDHLRGLADGPRLFLRSTHVYLMWSSLLNLALGASSRGAAPGRLHARLAGLAVLAGPPLLGASFFLEPYDAGLLRPLARAAIYLALGGMLVLAFAGWRRPSGSGGTGR